MRVSLLLASALAALALPAAAFYAPVNEPSPEKPLELSIRAGGYYDSNIFAAPAAAVESWVWRVSPRVAGRMMPTRRTFLTGSYTLDLERFADRPGDDTLLGHTLEARAVHSLSPTASLEIADRYAREENPAALLAGVPLSSDQSLERNQLDLRGAGEFGPRVTYHLDGRRIDLEYDDPFLSRLLDRREHRVRAGLAHPWLPELRLAAEYAYETIDYATAPETKDRRSHRLLLGADRALSAKGEVALRLGAEHRRRAGEGSAIFPAAEVRASWRPAPRSSLRAGYTLAREEVSSLDRYSEARLQRGTVSLEHALASRVTAALSASCDLARLQGRAGRPDADERAWRLGLAVSYEPTRRWSLSATLDRDETRSDDPGRDLRRTRAGASVRVRF